MKVITKEILAARLNNMEFDDEIRTYLLGIAKESNLLIIYSVHLDYIRFDGVFSEKVYRDEVFVTRKGLVRNKPNVKSGRASLKIESYHFGLKDEEEKMDPALYAQRGKPVWDFDCGPLQGKGAVFNIRERQDYCEGAIYFCRGIVVDMDEILPENS